MTQQHASLKESVAASATTAAEQLQAVEAKMHEAQEAMDTQLAAVRGSWPLPCGRQRHLTLAGPGCTRQGVRPHASTTAHLPVCVHCGPAGCQGGAQAPGGQLCRPVCSGCQGGQQQRRGGGNQPSAGPDQNKGAATDEGASAGHQGPGTWAGLRGQGAHRLPRLAARAHSALHARRSSGLASRATWTRCSTTASQSWRAAWGT